MYSRQKRLWGFSPPYSIYFILAILGYLSTTGIHYILIWYLEGRGIAYAISGVNTLAVIVAWIAALSVNPEPKENDLELNNRLCCKLRMKRETRYCPDCRKLVFELDHHCYFLNTCIGTKNYPAFLTLVIAALLQMILHVIISALFQSQHHHMSIIQEDILQEYWLVWVIVELQLIISVIQLILLLTLLCFHTYLISVKHLGTFDWMLQRRVMKRNRGSRYGNDENSMSSRLSEAAISAAKQRQERQMQREEFERSLAAGKKSGFEFFRHGGSSPSLLGANLGSSLKSFFSFASDSVRGDSFILYSDEPPQLADLDLGNMEGGSGRYVNDPTVRELMKEPVVITLNSRSNSNISDIRGQCIGETECTVKMPSMRDDNMAKSTDIPAALLLPTSSELPAVSEQPSIDTTESDSEHEAILKKRLKKSDLLKQTFISYNKVVPSSDVQDDDASTLHRAMVMQQDEHHHHHHHAAMRQGSMITVSYDLESVRHALVPEDAASVSTPPQKAEEGES